MSWPGTIYDDLTATSILFQHMHFVYISVFFFSLYYFLNIKRHGVVSLQELDESSAGCVIKRFGQICATESLSSILCLPSASLTVDDFHVKVIELCVKNSLPHVLLYYLDEFRQVQFLIICCLSEVFILQILFYFILVLQTS